MAKSRDWIVFNTLIGGFKCEHCQDTYKLTLPCPLPILRAVGNAFTQMHKGCKPLKVAIVKKNSDPSCAMETH